MFARLRRLAHLFFARLARLWRFDRPDGQATLRLRQPLLLAALVALLAWTIGRPSAAATLSLAALAGLFAAAYAWAVQLARHVTARRRLQYAAIQVGDEIEERITLSNASVLPVLWAEFADHSSIPGYTLSSVRATGGQSTLEWRAHSTCTQRGNYRFGPWELVMGDPFGLFQVTLASPQQEELLVYPPLAALPQQIIPRGRTLGDETLLRQALPAESMSAFSTRPYLPGDPLRRLHWPTTARRDAPFVKVFDPEAAAVLWLVPDLNAAVQRGSGPDSTLETMVVLMASLASRLLDERLAVGIIACGRPPQVVVPARGKPQLWQILRLLAGLQAATQPYAETLSQARAIITGRQRVVAITPSLQPGWVGQLQRFGAGQRPSAEVILLDPHSFDGQPGSDPAAAGFLALLASLGVPAHILSRGDIRPQAASYGELSRWEFQVLGTGRAHVRRAPRLLVQNRQAPP